MQEESDAEAKSLAGVLDSYSIPIKELAPIIISAAAFAVSLMSLVVSSVVAFRDRARIKTRSWYWPPSEYCKDSRIRIRIKNCGRRGIHLEHLVLDSDEGWHTYLEINESQTGVALDGGRSYHQILTAIDVHMEGNQPGGVSWARRLWFEDGLGKLYSPRGIRRHLRLLRNEPRFLDEAIELVVRKIRRW